MAQGSAGLGAINTVTPKERHALFVILTVTTLAPLIVASGARGAFDGQALRERFDRCLV